ncbi:PREDICTED: NEDD4-binding protein 2 [Crocodylus porosus]|uniref:NEDD4-binding protein 2 n=1 Tax=Crocodylus porosus TaxID=8502 RepID=UPI00093997DA|nr:PREDICTED: NEDD4-binding protein 2 [Crocodylus porosus]
MPKKRKNPGISPSRKIVNSDRTVNTVEGLEPSSRDTTMSHEMYSVNKEELFNSVSEMFSDLEPTVVYMVLSECDFKVENAMDWLLELSTAANGVASSEVSGFDSVASSLALVQQQRSLANEAMKESSAKKDPVNFKKETEKVLSPDTQLTEELDSLIQNAFEKYRLEDKLQATEYSSSSAITESPEWKKSTLGCNAMLFQSEINNGKLENFSFTCSAKCHKSPQPAVSQLSLRTKERSSADMDNFTQVLKDCRLPDIHADNGAALEIIELANWEMGHKNPDQMPNVVSNDESLNCTSGQSSHELLESGTAVFGNSSSKCCEQQEEDMAVCSGHRNIFIPAAFTSFEGSSFKPLNRSDFQQFEHSCNFNFSISPQQLHQPPWNPLASELYPLSGSHSFVTPVAVSPGQWRPASDSRTFGKGVPFSSSVVSNVQDSNASLKIWGHQDGNQKMNLSQVYQPSVCHMMRKKTHFVGQVLVLLRGVPGSGKSFLARNLLEDNPGGIILSTDDYFYKNEQYQYDANCLGEAHEWNKIQAKKAFEKGVSPIIIDNTNIQAWEMKPYIALAQQYKYKVMFREPDTWWKFKPKELERRNIHGVSKEKIKRMLERYERCLTVNSVLNSTVPNKSEITIWNEEPTRDESCGQKETHTYVKEEGPLASLLTSLELAEDKSVSATSSVLENSCVISDNVDIYLSEHDEKVPLKKDKKTEEMHRNIETEASETDTVISEETTGLHICSCEAVQEYSDNKILEDQSEVDQYTEIPLEPELIQIKDVTKQNDSILVTSMKPELLNFVGDWPVEQTMGQRTRRTRRIEKSSVISDEDNKATSQPPLESCEAEVGLADIQPGEKQQEDILPCDTPSVCGTEKNAAELEMVGDWPASSSLEQRQHRSRRTRKTSQSQSDEAGNSKCDLHKNILSTVNVLHGTSLGIEKLQDAEKSTFDKLETVTSEIVSERKPQQNKRSRKHHKLAVTFTNHDLALSRPEEQLSTPNSLEENLEIHAYKQLSSYTQTEPQDFALLWRIEKKIIISESPKVLNSRLDGFRPKDMDSASDSLEKIPYRVTYDKSTYVEESELTSIDESENLNILCKLFGSFSFEALKDLYERCNKDIVWATGLLLDSDEKLYKDKEIECLQEQGTEPLVINLHSKANTNCGDNLNNSEQTNEIIMTDGVQLSEDNNLSIFDTESKTTDILEIAAEVPDSLMSLSLDSLVEPRNTNDIASRTDAETTGTEMEQSISEIQEVNLNNTSLVYEVENKLPVLQPDVGLYASMTFPNVLNPPIAILEPQLNKDRDSELSERDPENPEVDKTIIQFSQMDQAAFMNPASDKQEFGTDKETQGNPMISVGNVKEQSKISDSNEDKTKIPVSSRSLNIDCLELTLPAELALQLKEIFGPVGIDSGSLTLEDCVVHIDLNLAKVIHEKWKESIMKRQRKEDGSYKLLVEGPTLIEQLDLDDSGIFLSQSTDSKLQKKKMTWASSSSNITQIKNSAAPEVFPFMDHWNAQTQKVSLREIMCEEIALQEKQDLKRATCMARKDCAAKLKEKQLFEMFPTINQNFLRDIFKDNNYSLEQTEQFLNCVLEADPVRTVVVQGAVQQSETLLSCSTVKNRDKKAKKFKEDEDVMRKISFQDIEYPGYDDFRAEAFLHQQKRQDCLKKAGEAYCMGMKPVAAFYAQQGRLHEQKMKEANHAAAVQIFEKVNTSLLPMNVLDLHGLHVDEAMNHLSRVLQEKSEEYKQTGGKPYLCVITGRGSHSQGGVARIKPAAIKYLTSHNFRFTEIKPGCLKVMLK